MILTYTQITGNVQNIGRFLTSSVTSSTLLGRFIYWKDGIQELLRHPFGLGYLGYYYREPVIQTAFYSVRFVHNDFLQLGLDIGIVPAILFVASYFKIFSEKNLSFERKTTLLIMFLHFFMDFDLEFTSMWYLLGLVTYVSEEAQVEDIDHANYRKYVMMGIKVFTGICGFFGVYVGSSMLPRYLGNAELTSTLIPYYTENNVEMLSQETDVIKAQNLAEKIYRQNPYIPETYDVFAVLAFQREDYEKVIKEKEKSISLQKYNMDAYERYAMLLAKGMNVAAQKGEERNIKILIEGVKRIPELINQVKRHTTELAYKTKDVPDFMLSEATQKILKEIDKLGAS